MGTTLRHRILPDEQGERLDRILARAWPELTRSRIQSLLKQGHVTVDTRPARASDSARAGQLAEAALPDVLPSLLVPEAIPLSIVYEDASLLVVDKPAGLVVHPGAGVKHGTLVHALLAHAPTLAGVGGVARPGLVHRLDKDTTGLLVVAKTDAAFQALTKDLARRAIARRYLARAGACRDRWGRRSYRGRARRDPRTEAHRRAPRRQRGGAFGGHALARSGNTSAGCGAAAIQLALSFLGNRAHAPDPRSFEPCRISGRRRRNIRWRRQKGLEPPTNRP
jgi:23S rRNA-/tRNA-specific pseudouridylate synthase